MKRIRTGDIVSVSFHNARHTLLKKAEVLYTPEGAGESWIFQDLDTGVIYDISEGCTVRKSNTP